MNLPVGEREQSTTCCLDEGGFRCLQWTASSSLISAWSVDLFSGLDLLSQRAHRHLRGVFPVCSARGNDCQLVEPVCEHRKIHLFRVRRGDVRVCVCGE